MQLQLTDAGRAKLQAAQGPIQLTTYVLGSAYNYMPSGSDTNIHGTVVFQSGTAQQPAITTPTPQGSNIYRYSVALDATIGDFQFGELGMFTSDGTLFALAAADTLIQKFRTGGNGLGNTIELDLYLQIQGSNFYLWMAPSASDNQLALGVLPSADALPMPAQARPNIYTIQASQTYEAFLAYTDTQRTWSFNNYTLKQASPTAGNTLNSVTIPLSLYHSWMNPLFYGQVLIQIVEANTLTGAVRTVLNTVLTSSTATINFSTPLSTVPEDGASVGFYTSEVISPVINIPIASATVLGGVMIPANGGLNIDAQGNLTATATQYVLPIATNLTLGGVRVGPSLQIDSTTGILNAQVSSVAGRVGAVVLTTNDISGLARVATTGSYTDLINTPPALTPANASTLGGVIVPNGGGLTIDTSGNLSAVLKTVAGQAPNQTTGDVALAVANITGAAPIASPTFTGTPKAPTPTTGDNTTNIATTAFVALAINNAVVSFNGRTGAVTLTSSDITTAGGATLASPAFTGTPTAPTAVIGDSSTTIATTAFVNSTLTNSLTGYVKSVDLASTTDTTKGIAMAGWDGVLFSQYLKTRNERVVDTYNQLRNLLNVLYNRAFLSGALTLADGTSGHWYVDSTDTSSGALVTGSMSPITAPAAPTLNQSALGSQGARTYYVKITYVTAAGETLASLESSLAISANNVMTVTSPPATTGATGYNIYVSTSSGTETKQNATPQNIGITWSEPASGLVAGSALPSVSTAGSILNVTGVTSGAVAVGQSVNGASGVTPTTLVAQGSGTGGTGTYIVDVAQNVAAGTTLACDLPAQYLVAYDGARWKPLGGGKTGPVLLTYNARVTPAAGATSTLTPSISGPGFLIMRMKTTLNSAGPYNYDITITSGTTQMYKIAGSTAAVYDNLPVFAENLGSYSIAITNNAASALDITFDMLYSKTTT